MSAPIPAGCSDNGPCTINGRTVWMLTDDLTGSTFCVPVNATTEDIQAEQRRCRDRFMSAGAAFAPV